MSTVFDIVYKVGQNKGKGVECLGAKRVIGLGIKGSSLPKRLFYR